MTGLQHHNREPEAHWEHFPHDADVGVRGDKIAVIASSQLTNEDAWILKQLFIDRLGAKSADVFVDPIAPNTAWLTGR